MRRAISCSLTATAAGAARVELQVAVAGPPPPDERLEVAVDGVVLEATELPGPAGGRIHALRVPAGRVEVRYSCTAEHGPGPEPAGPLDEVEYLRPSRYAEADRLVGLARAEFGVRDARSLATAVPAWVGQRLRYVEGSSRGTDSSLDTLLSGAGVCRDYAHLTIALLRACDVPARMASVYAPGLHPMDFHAVVEVLVDGAWYVTDPTLLAPRPSLVRIATGRDAADTAFLSAYGGEVRLDAMQVQAVVDGDLPDDDIRQLVQLR